MKKLLREYGFNSDMQYMEMICESFINGQYSQAVEQFTAMPRKDRVNMLKSKFIYNMFPGLQNQNAERLFNNL